MKKSNLTVYIAAILFGIVIASVIINGIYVHAVCDEFLSKLHQDPGIVSQENVENFRSEFQRNRILLGLSINHDRLERINELSVMLLEFAKQQNSAMYRAYLAALTELIEELRESEKLSFKNIF